MGAPKHMASKRVSELYGDRRGLYLLANKLRMKSVQTTRAEERKRSLLLSYLHPVIPAVGTIAYANHVEILPAPRFPVCSRRE